MGQHHNPANRLAHFETTGPEIWHDTGGEIDVLVAGLGTCGTVSGIAGFIKPKRPSLHVVGVEPEGAALISKGEWAPHGIMGLSPGFIPDNLDRNLIDEITTVTDSQAYAACRALAESEGILVGISSGANAHVAALLAKREEFAGTGKRIVCIFADTGERYFSVDGMFTKAQS